MKSFLGKLATIDYQQLTNREAKLVNYIKENLEEIVDNNVKIKDLAEKVEVGFSAFYGLFRKLEINGKYPELFISLVNDLDNTKIGVAKDDENVKKKHIDLINQNHSLIKKSELFASLKLIRESQRIFISYWESILRGPASELDNFFYAKGLQVILLDSDWSTINQRVDLMQEKDLFIFYTKYGTSRHLEKVIEKIKTKGGKVIFVSGRIPSSTNAKNVDSTHTLAVDTINLENKEEYSVSSVVPFHYFNELLIYHYLYAPKA